MPDRKLHTAGSCAELEAACMLMNDTRAVMHCMQDRKLQLYSFQGVKTREWVMDSVIRSTV